MATTLKVEITVREDDDRVVVKTLEGEEAKKWERYMKTVCTLAFAHNQNPDWGSLNWQKQEISTLEPGS